MTDDELNAIERRASAATPNSCPCDIRQHDTNCNRCDGGAACPFRCECICHCPGERFYQARRADVPALVAEVRRLKDAEAERARFERLFDQWQSKAEAISAEVQRLEGALRDMEAKLSDSISLKAHEACCEEHARQTASCDMDHHAEAAALRAVLAELVAVKDLLRMDGEATPEQWDREQAAWTEARGLLEEKP